MYGLNSHFRTSKLILDEIGHNIPKNHPGLNPKPTFNCKKQYHTITLIIKLLKTLRLTQITYLLTFISKYGKFVITHYLFVLWGEGRGIMTLIRSMIYKQTTKIYIVDVL